MDEFPADMLARLREYRDVFAPPGPGDGPVLVDDAAGELASCLRQVVWVLDRYDTDLTMDTLIPAQVVLGDARRLFTTRGGEWLLAEDGDGRLEQLRAVIDTLEQAHSVSVALDPREKRPERTTGMR